MSLKKKKKESIQTFSNKAILKISLTVSLLLFFVMIIGVVYAMAREIGTKAIFLQFLSIRTLFAFLSVIFTFFFLFKFQFWVIKKTKKHQKGLAIKLLLGSFVLTIILSIISADINWMLFPQEGATLNMVLTVHFFRDLIILVITALITTILLMWDKRQETIIENQKLSMENLQNRYEALKNQVDPHFLFNSLNTLNGLIGYDDEKAHDYLDQLSSVFRYTMQNKKIIYVEEELSFVESYIYLMKIRYNESLQVESNIDVKYLKYHILPFGLQLLIENCIKHNVISNKYPLLITIETTENETIKVKNTIRLKPDVLSSGVGLNNLNERYKLVFEKEIKIHQDETFFTVEIPLVKDIEKYNNKLEVSQADWCNSIIN